MILLDAAQATVPASGAVTVSIGPAAAGSWWRVSTIRATGNGAAQPTLQCWRGDAYIAGTTSANDDTASGDPLDLFAGDALQMRWSGATPGATVRAECWGTHSGMTG